jgi:hypothetical protein
MTTILKQEILKCNILQKEYKHISNIIFNIQNIIIKNENILIFSKNQVMITLNELIKKLNENYNDSIINILSTDVIINDIQNDSIYSDIMDLKSELKTEEDSNDEFIENNNNKSENSICDKKINNNNFSDKNINYPNDNFKLSNNNYINLDFIEKIKILLSEIDINIENKKYNFLYELAKYNPFSEVKKNIILLCKIVGFTSIEDIIYLTLHLNNYKFNEYDKQILDLLNNILPIMEKDPFFTVKNRQDYEGKHDAN